MNTPLLLAPRIAAACLAMALLPHGGAAAGTEPALQQRIPSRGWLRIEVHQNGRAVPAKNHEVVLERKPFDLVLYLPDKESVSVRAASHAALFDLARSGAPLGKIFNPAQTSAFVPFNKDEDMMLDDPRIQEAWWYDSAGKDHTFNEVTPVPGGFRCRRRISNFFIGGSPQPIEKTDFDAIYLVFLTGKSSSDRLSTLEDQRGYLKIGFAAGAASGAPPAAGNTSPSVFAIAVEQLDSEVPITANEVRVRKAPFDLVVDLKGIPGVYVHAATDSAFFEKAQRGEPLGQVFRKGQTIALGRFNEKQVLFLNSPESHQFWYAFGRTEHDFNLVTPAAGGVRGRRTVTNLFMSGAPVLVHRTPYSVLYLVFYAGDLGGDGDDGPKQRGLERQRQVLKITMQ